MRWVFGALTLLFVFVLGLWAIADAVEHQQTQVRACREKGGTPIVDRSGIVFCLSPRARLAP
jgi:hypothetical protein